MKKGVHLYLRSNISSPSLISFASWMHRHHSTTCVQPSLKIPASLVAFLTPQLKDKTNVKERFEWCNVRKGLVLLDDAWTCFSPPYRAH